MIHVEDMIQAAEKLCNTLELASQNEKQFCNELCAKFEIMSWELWRSANDMKEAINFYGVSNG